MKFITHILVIMLVAGAFSVATQDRFSSFSHAVASFIFGGWIGWVSYKAFR